MGKSVQNLRYLLIQQDLESHSSTNASHESWDDNECDIVYHRKWFQTWAHMFQLSTRCGSPFQEAVK